PSWNCLLGHLWFRAMQLSNQHAFRVVDTQSRRVLPVSYTAGSGNAVLDLSWLVSHCSISPCCVDRQIQPHAEPSRIVIGATFSVGVKTCNALSEQKISAWTPKGLHALVRGRFHLFGRVFDGEPVSTHPGRNALR